MYCSNCGQAIVEGARFCAGCGAAAQVTVPATLFCASCGTSIPQAGQFCPACGRPAVRSTAVGASTGQWQGTADGAVARGPLHASAWVTATGFLSNRVWAQLLACALIVVIIVDVVAIFSDIAEINLVSRMLNGEFVSLGEAESSDNRQGTIGMIQLVLVVGTAVLFVTWMYRSHSNLRAFNTRGLQYSPGWAIGGWFVPFLNLWRPYQVMCEIWKASSPNSRDGDDEAWRRESTSALLGWWWAAWILSGIVGWVLLRTFFSDPEDLEMLQARSIGYLVGDGIDIVAAILAILIVSRITGRQEEKNRMLEAIAAEGGRPPGPALAAPVWAGVEAARPASDPGAPLAPNADAVSLSPRRGYCERCGQELGVNEKMRGLTVHERCPTPAPEAPAAAPAADAVETGPSVPAVPPAPDAAVGSPSTGRGYCGRCGQELGVNEKMMGLTAHKVCPMPVSEAPEAPPAQASQVYCKECETPMPASSLFCHKCGSAVVAAAE